MQEKVWSMESRQFGSQKVDGQIERLVHWFSTLSLAIGQLEEEDNLIMMHLAFTTNETNNVDSIFCN